MASHAGAVYGAAGPVVALCDSGPATIARKGWRDVLPVHAAADMFPMMPDTELAILREDIRTHGLNEPIVMFEGQILDGRNRYRACVEAGVTPTFRIAVQSPETANLARPLIKDPVAYVVSANIHRRHLTAEQKRDLIAKLLKSDPDKSDRAIAATVRVDQRRSAQCGRKPKDVGKFPTSKPGPIPSAGRSRRGRNSGQTLTLCTRTAARNRSPPPGQSRCSPRAECQPTT
jgi:hypothetical protein